MLISDSIHLTIAVGVDDGFVVVIHILFTSLQQLTQPVILAILTFVHFQVVLLVLVNLSQNLVGD